MMQTILKLISVNLRPTLQATVDTRWSNTVACLQVNLLLMQISIIIIRQQHLLILVILKTKCLFFSNSCQWIRFNIKHWASLSLFKLRMYSCTLIDRFIHKKRFSHNIVFFFFKKKEDSEVWGDLRTPRPLSWGSSASSSRSSANTAPGSRTSRWPGPGNWWTGRGSRKWWWWYWKKRVGLGGGRWKKRRSVSVSGVCKHNGTRTSCRHGALQLPAVRFFCLRARLVDSQLRADWR